MDWKKTYESRKMSADEAVKLIKSGDTVVFAHAVAEPVALVAAMVRANTQRKRTVTYSDMKDGSLHLQ